MKISRNVKQQLSIRVKTFTNRVLICRQKSPNKIKFKILRKRTRNLLIHEMPLKLTENSRGSKQSKRGRILLLDVPKVPPLIPKVLLYANLRPSLNRISNLANPVDQTQAKRSQFNRISMKNLKTPSKYQIEKKTSTLLKRLNQSILMMRKRLTWRK